MLKFEHQQPIQEILNMSEQREGLVPATENIDPRYTIHKCGMEADLKANGLDRMDIQEQVLNHADLITRALLAGEPMPVHSRPGIQLLSIAVANNVINQGASGLARYMNINLAELYEQAASDHISSC